MSARFELNPSHLSGLGFHRDKPNTRVGKSEQGDLRVHSFHPEIPFFTPRVFGEAGVERAQLSPCIFGVQFWGMAGIRSLFVRDQIPFLSGC